MAILPMGKVIGRAFFRKRATLATPKVFPQTRGHIVNEIDKCIFCGICQKRCPTGAITVDRAARTWAIAQFDCAQCNCCADVCPKKCLAMNNEPPHATSEQARLKMQGAPLPPKPEKPADA